MINCTLHSNSAFDCGYLYLNLPNRWFFYDFYVVGCIQTIKLIVPIFIIIINIYIRLLEMVLNYVASIHGTFNYRVIQLSLSHQIVKPTFKTTSTRLRVGNLVTLCFSCIILIILKANKRPIISSVHRILWCMRYIQYCTL